MKTVLKRTLAAFATLCLLLSLNGCGLNINLPELPKPTSTEPVPQTEPTPTCEPTPTYEPTPEPLLAGDAVTVNAVQLESGSVVSSDRLYVKLREYAWALRQELLTDGTTATIVWRGETVTFTFNSQIIQRGDAERDIEAPIISYGGELWIPANEVSRALDIGLYYDRDMAHLYCTPEAGDWALNNGYAVPVLMYHGVTDNVWGCEDLFVSPSDMDAQLKYLVDNGYQPIWFEDLINVAQYDKPVILTFDDGYEDNYSELYPILQKYNVKATIFVISGYIGGDKYLTAEQVKELSNSGLVSIQSHTASHPDMATLDRQQQEEQMAQSKMTLLRLTGREPFVLCYPSGSTNEDTEELSLMYYRFGIKMLGYTYVTGDAPAIISRYYVARSCTLDEFAALLG